MKHGMIKTPEEIALLREGGKHLARILYAVKDKVVPGVSTGVLDAFAEKLIEECGGVPAFKNYTPEGARHAYPGTLCVAVNDEVVHGIAGDKILNEGDIIGIDLGMNYKGFFVDMAITVAVGNIDASAKKLIQATEGALMAGIDEVRAGKAVGDIGNAIEAHVRKHNFVVVEELGGHGVGYSQHEDPHIANYGERGEGVKLRVGMVLALEPIVNEGTRFVKILSDGYTFVTRDHKRSAHFEHTILVTEGDPEILTNVSL